MVKAREDGGRTLALDILARAEEPSPVGVVVTLDKAQVMRPCEGVRCSSWLLANLGMGLGCWVPVSIAQAFYAIRRVTNTFRGIVVMLWRVANAASKP